MVHASMKNLLKLRLVALNSGAIVISLLTMAVVAANGLRESAYPEVSRDPVGTTL